MEDNEFEEVTIISHTDQAASILPQQTAERLMKEIRMEVTQKISQTENVKMGSLQHSEATILLDKIHESLICDPPKLLLRQAYFVGKLSEDEYSLITDSGAYKITPNAEEPVSRLFSTTQWKGAVFLQPFEEYFMLVVGDHSIEVYGPEGQLVHLSKHLNTSWKVEVFRNVIYFRTEDLQLARLTVNASEADPIKGRWSEEVISKITSIPVSHDADELANFCICNRTSRPVLLTKNGTLKVAHHSQNLESHFEKSWFCLIKQMYSDHFLVAELDEHVYNTFYIHLVDFKSFKTYFTLKLENSSAGLIEIIRLLNPLRRIEFFMVVTAQSLQLCAKLATTLWFVTKLDFQHQLFSLMPVADSTWIVGGELMGLHGLTLHFPDALKL